jgi:hypothetical protein
MRQLKNVKIKLCDYSKQENKMQEDFFLYRLLSKKPLQQESKILYHAKAIKNESVFTPSPGGGQPEKSRVGVTTSPIIFSVNLQY